MSNVTVSDTVARHSVSTEVAFEVEDFLHLSTTTSINIISLIQP